MIETKKFKDIGCNIAQIGFYLMTIDQTIFTDTELHRNIVSLLSQMSLYLNDVMLGKVTKKIDTTAAVAPTTSSEYISRKEVVKMYHPLITEYGLTQAINKNELRYIKRGSKYFFEPNEVKKWIEEKSSHSNSVSNYKFV